MKLVFITPNSTPNANDSLSSIYHYVQHYFPRSVLSGKLLHDSVNITYGYLGLYTRLLLQDKLDSQLLKSSYILDHAYVPSKLKGKVFRVSGMNKSLTSILCHKCLLTSSEVDAIYSNLKDISNSSTVNLSIPSASSYESGQSFSLLIKKSLILSRFPVGLAANSLTNEWISKFNNFERPLMHDKSSKGLISLKKSEASFSPSYKLKFKKYRTKNVPVDYADISNVFSPTSMFVIPFILHCIPSALSASHPLYRLLGDYVPSLSKKEALDLIMQVILKTSISIDRFPQFVESLGHSLD